jgi:hypothetical protein
MGEVAATSVPAGVETCDGSEGCLQPAKARRAMRVKVADVKVFMIHRIWLFWNGLLTNITANIGIAANLQPITQNVNKLFIISIIEYSRSG